MQLPTAPANLAMPRLTECAPAWLAPNTFVITRSHGRLAQTASTMARPVATGQTPAWPGLSRLVGWHLAAPERPGLALGAEERPGGQADGAAAPGGCPKVCLSGH